MICFIGVVFIVIPLLIYYKQTDLLRNKIEADAVAMKAKQVDLPDNERRYYAVLRYSAGGEQYETEHLMEQGIGNMQKGFREGDTVRIYCHRGNPQRIMLPKDVSRSWHIAALVLCVLIEITFICIALVRVGDL